MNNGMWKNPETLKTSLENLKPYLNKNDKQLNYGSLMMYIVTPFLNSLGYNTFNINEVCVNLADGNTLVSVTTDLKFILSLSELEPVTFKDDNNVKIHIYLDSDNFFIKTKVKTLNQWEDFSLVSLATINSDNKELESENRKTFTNLLKLLDKDRLIGQYSEIGDKIFNNDILKIKFSDGQYDNLFVKQAIMSEFENPSNYLIDAITYKLVSDFVTLNYEEVLEYTKSLSENNNFLNLIQNIYGESFSSNGDNIVESENHIDEELTDNQSENLEQERIQAEIAEQERLEQERIQAETVEQERLEQERIQAEIAEQERLEQERIQAETVEQERLEQEHIQAEIAEQERLEQERIQAEIAEQERLEQERIQAEIAEQERLEQERIQAEIAEQERLEQERIQAEIAEQERLEQERIQAEIAEQERLEQERIQAEIAEQERLEQERIQAEIAEQKRLEQERIQAENSPIFTGFKVEHDYPQQPKPKNPLFKDYKDREKEVVDINSFFGLTEEKNTDVSSLFGVQDEDSTQDNSKENTDVSSLFGVQTENSDTEQVEKEPEIVEPEIVEPEIVEPEIVEPEAVEPEVQNDKYDIDSIFKKEEEPVKQDKYNIDEIFGNKDEEEDLIEYHYDRRGKKFYYDDWGDKVYVDNDEEFAILQEVTDKDSLLNLSENASLETLDSTEKLMPPRHRGFSRFDD